MLDAPHLQSTPADPSDFRDHLERAASRGDPFAVFGNLGGDARLIAPAASGEQYGSFLDILDAGDMAQKLWSVVGAEVQALVAAGRVVFLNTEGSGVPWLHVRLDSHPKYYKYRPYTASA